MLKLPLSCSPPVGASFFVDKQERITKVEVVVPFERWSVSSDALTKEQLVRFTEHLLLPWAESWLCGKKAFLPLAPFPRLEQLQAGLFSVERGMTISYTEFARRCGMPLAIRHAARLLSCNPFPLILPCHRVIRKNGSIGRYLAGSSAKAALLFFET